MTRTITRRTFGRHALATAAFASAFALVGNVAPARAGELISQSFFGTAIGGYDPVAYFTVGRSIEGSKAYTYDWLGATWRFTSVEHRELFAADPIKYTPQYGGYCASSMTGGSIVPAAPDAWSIVDGRLYLLYSLGAVARWRINTAVKVASADDHWQEISQRLEQ